MSALPKIGGGTRGLKKLGAPAISVPMARHWFTIMRIMSLGNSMPLKLGMPSGGWVTVSQKARSFSTRCSGGLPAIRAALMAPIEMPATQSGCRPASASA